MSQAFDIVAGHWRQSFGTEYPLSPDEHTRVVEKIHGAVTAMFPPGSKEFDKLIAALGVMGFYAGLCAAPYVCNDRVYPDRAPGWRSQAEAYICFAPRVGAGAAMRHDGPLRGETT